MAKPTELSPPIASTIQFSPAIPMPAVSDVPKRIQELHSYLDPKNPQRQPKQQHANIKAAIKLYEDGRIDGLQHVFLMEGKLVTEEQVFKGSAWAWGEVDSFKSPHFHINSTNNWAQITGQIPSACSEALNFVVDFWKFDSDLLYFFKGLSTMAGFRGIVTGSNNISAVQIRDDYERRRQAAEQQAQQEAAANGEVEEDEKTEEREETVEQKKKRKRQEEKAIAKIKQSKDFKRRKASKPGETDDDDEDIAWDMYKKSKPLPGQLENCEVCDKRFTVTAYSKTGPEGGLLCAKCSKSIEADQKKEKPKKTAANRNKRRQVQSNLLDGIVQLGPKSLQELCVEKVADNINDIDEFGDLPPALLDRLSQILSKRRVLTSRTLDLFLRPDLDTISLYDCGKLEPEDFKKIFAIIPKLQDLSLHNAGQIKDEVIEYILERGVPIKHLQLEASNLVSDEEWRELFQRHGRQLETLKLSWLDFSMDDETVAHLAAGCPNITRLKLKKLFKIGDKSLESIAEMKNLKHLSLRFVQPTSAETLAKLIAAVGPNLRTLSLEKFENADDGVLQTIHTCCRHLNKFRFTDNDFCTDKGFVDLFTGWDNPPLSFLDLASNRDLDYTNPDGPEDPIGLASEGFKAMMRHSRSLIERLDISSCRHISHAAFLETFDGVQRYPCLKDINISFLTMIDTPVAVGIFKSCPQLRKLTAFGCFNVRDVLVPPGVALIGLPNAQESIVVEGEMIGDL